jgi:hypothetical protein
VIATNDYGDSITSESGNGAVIVLVPDAPSDVRNDPTVTKNNVIGLQWDEGPTDGGSTIIDYRITYD